MHQIFTLMIFLLALRSSALLPSTRVAFRRPPPRFPSLSSTSSTSKSSPEWPLRKIRSTFIDHFSALSPSPHTPYDGSPLTPPPSDPTLLFTNAGMNQFKPIFLGQTDPSSPLASLTSAVNTQKCIRAGGKHNDLEEVGVDEYHHTFFEMLGTWSFNSNYDKRFAIATAYDVLTNVYNIDSSRLYFTYFEGDPSLNLPPDSETKDIWESILPPSLHNHIIACGAADNFWEMGDTGPCGGCTEIHYDRIGDRDASALVNKDDPKVIEIWNLVFIEFSKSLDQETNEIVLNNLPSNHIDTGMGLERLASVLQGYDSNYDTDAFVSIFAAIEKTTPPSIPSYGSSLTSKTDIAYRVLADHSRCLTFALAEGLTPSNEGRGYVLRRILRRALRFGKEVLGGDLDGNFLSSICAAVVGEFGEDFPELKMNEKRVVEIIREEELSFNTLLSRGIKYFNDEITPKGVVSGADAFFMYDTLGFPLDLTTLMANDRSLEVDVEAFDAEMEQQKERSREANKSAKKGVGDISGSFALEAAQTSYLKDEKMLGYSDDGDKYNEDGVDTFGTVVAIYDGGGNFVERVEGSTEYWGLVLDKTSFYAEAGGQINDVGVINVVSSTSPTPVVFNVVDVQSYGGYVIHVGKFEGDGGGGVMVGDTSITSVDMVNRGKVKPNHTMTHVLNFALRRVLGGEVDQRGSLVTGDKLRFDFTANKGLTLGEVEEAEKIVNDIIEEGLDVFEETISLAGASKIGGVRAVFGESYPDPVRVISVGKSIQCLVEGGGGG